MPRPPRPPRPPLTALTASYVSRAVEAMYGINTVARHHTMTLGRGDSPEERVPLPLGASKEEAVRHGAAYARYLVGWIEAGVYEDAGLRREQVYEAYLNEVEPE